MRTLASLIMLFMLSLSAGAQPRRTMEIYNSFVRVSVEPRSGAMHETYAARTVSGWMELVESGSDRRPDPALRQNGTDIQVRYSDVSFSTADTSEQYMRLFSHNTWGDIIKIITLRPGERFARIEISYVPSKASTVQSFSSTYSFAPGGKTYAAYKPLDFIFTPQLRPEPEQVIADHVFRSPALMMQKGGSFAALVPVLESIDGKGRALRTVGDLQVETADRPFFTLGLENFMPEPYRMRNTHVFYAAPDSLAAHVPADTGLSLRFLLFLRADAPAKEGYRDIVRYHWASSGTKYMQRAVGPQSEPFSSYIHKAWYEFLPQIARTTKYKNKPVTLLTQARLAWSNKLPKAADNDSWFNVWFNALRTAYGIYFYGHQIGDKQLMTEAEQVLNLALLAPQREGIAPSIFYVDSAGGHWVADQGWGGIDDGRDYPMIHNAWTCYWLLQWIDMIPQRSDEILPFTRRFADFLCAKQHPNGVIPSWYDPVTLEAVPTFRDENAETACAALFLAEFARRTKESAYLERAERAMDFIFKVMMPDRKWFDYETFFSCSRKAIGFYDSYTQQQPQNTLSMQEAAEACALLYRMTGKEMYKEQGTAIMDYLCLYQQVWSPRWLSCELFGGFGVQNTDAEWSDSRQGYFAMTLMEYYELTGKKEYFERSVAALRAMFSLFESPTSPRTAENYGHSGTDHPAGVTGMHWGTGSSVVSIHLITHKYGDAFVNVQGGWGVGIDGCRIPSVTVNGSTIHMTIEDNVSVHRAITLKFGNAGRHEYDVVINGKALGTWSSASLQKGIHVDL